MRYRNTKTGAIIDSLCVISGGDWVVEVSKPDTAEVKTPEETKPTKKRR